MVNMHACIAHPCQKKRKKGRGFCTAHTAVHDASAKDGAIYRLRRLIDGHRDDMEAVKKQWVTDPQPTKNNVWEGDVGYDVNS